ncbi:ABC transporter ATP-binding protein [Cohnella herbarum]|uniref:ABC transporter ATP-binding protein n=1 Tax=Cohnella herbarum TaxID=2728023 RepID=A0A7Z2ZKH8_9BACL|nr:ABC transporter ATP-binding protein [Cohnella herbarum]QJD82988.1 ABC transporter ATP-binding protein [Cohnella herbarum]
MKPMLEVKGLSKSWGDFGLKDVSFTLYEGCITGFIGVNGAGKTTTIKSILGLTRKDAGNITFYGKDTQRYEREFKNRIGIVLSDGNFYDDLNLLEMKSIIAPSYSNWDNAIFVKRMERFGLSANQKIKTLSKGMRMKYSIVLAISHHADLLIMDEPTSGLDPQVRSELMNILLEFVKEEGKSVFFSSHVTSDLDKVADALILIDKGRVVLDEEKDVLRERHSVVKGDCRQLDGVRDLFLTLEETKYGFTGLTDNPAAVHKQMKDVLFERPSVEEIMLGYIGR